MHQQSLMLLHPMVKEKMHLQENTLFDLDLEKFQKFKVPFTGPFVSTDGRRQNYIPQTSLRDNILNHALISLNL